MAEEKKETLEEAKEEQQQEELSKEASEETKPVTEEKEVKKFTQEQVSKLVGEARKKTRAKYEDYEQLKAENEELKGLKETNENLKAENDNLKAEKESAEMRQRLANETGIDLEIVNLFGGKDISEDELKSKIETYKNKTSYDVVPKTNGKTNIEPKQNKSVEEDLAEQIESMIS